MTDKKKVTIDETALPDNWKVATLSDITDYIQRGKSPKYTVHSALPVINQKCIRWFGIEKEHLKYVHPDQWEKWAPQRYVQEGDILWNSTGTGTIGRAAVIKHLAPGEKYVVDSHVTIVRPKEVEPLYVHYWIMSHAVQGSIEAMQSGSTNQVELNKAAVEALPIPVAPLEQQTRIVAEIEKQFSRLDEAVANLKRVKANLKRYKAAVLKAAVEGKLTEEWRKQHPGVEPASKLLERILAERRQKWEEAELAKMKAKGKVPKDDKWKKRYKEAEVPKKEDTFEIPETWSWTNLGQLSCSVKDGPHYSPKYSETGIPFISGGNIRPEGIDFASAKYISPELHAKLSERCKPEAGDLLYTKGGTTGIARINTETRDFNVWVHVAVLRLVDSLERFYLQHALNSNHCYRQSQRYTHGVGNQDLGLTRMIWITVPLPPLKEQKVIIQEIDQRMAIITNIEKQVLSDLKRADKLRQSILQKAFSGELVVPEPNDEPASILLERIRIASETIKPTKKKIPHKRAKAMKKVPRKPIIEVLKASGKKMTPTELLTAAGFSIEPDDVEEFYLELKGKINAGEIVEERPNKTDSYLKVV